MPPNILGLPVVLQLSNSQNLRRTFSWYRILEQFSQSIFISNLDILAQNYHGSLKYDHKTCLCKLWSKVIVYDQPRPACQQRSASYRFNCNRTRHTQSPIAYEYAISIHTSMCFLVRHILNISCNVSKNFLGRGSLMYNHKISCLCRLRPAGLARRGRPAVPKVHGYALAFCATKKPCPSFA